MCLLAQLIAQGAHFLGCLFGVIWNKERRQAFMSYSGQSLDSGCPQEEKLTLGEVFCSAVAGFRWELSASSTPSSWENERFSPGSRANNLHGSPQHPLPSISCTVQLHVHHISSWRASSGFWCATFPGTHTKRQVDQINCRHSIPTPLQLVLKLQMIFFASLFYHLL